MTLAVKVALKPNSTNQPIDYSKLKAFADKKLDVIEKLNFVMERLENFVGKGENAGY